MMRAFFVLALVGACIACASPPRVWTDAESSLSVTVPADWVEADGVIPVSGEKLVVFQTPAAGAHQSEGGIPFVRECSIGRTHHQNGHKDQSQINEMMADGQMVDFLIRMAGATTEHSRGNEIIQGIRVVSYDIDMDPTRGLLAAFAQVTRPGLEFPEITPVRLMTRMFTIPADDGMLQYIMVCSASSGPDAEKDIASMLEFMGSMEFQTAAN